MKALVIVVLCVLGLWGICKGINRTLSNKERQSFHNTMQKANEGMRKAAVAANEFVDHAFEKPLEWTEKEWPSVFKDDIMGYLDHHNRDLGQPQTPQPPKQQPTRRAKH